MPEGDTVYKVARALQPLLEGEPLEALWLRDRGELAELAGARVDEVASLGKHFLIAIGKGVVLHVHLGLHGKWHRYRPGETPRGSGMPSLRIETKAWRLLCYRAKVAELVRRSELGAHPSLARLGPDLLAEPVAFATILARARSAAPATAGELLIDQRIACGIGNAFKNEVLFLEGVHPSADPRGLSDEQLLSLYRTGRELLLKNLGGWPRTTTRAVRPGEPWPPGEPRHFVFERTGLPCPRCTARIGFYRQGDFATPTYFCPDCQPRVAAPDCQPRADAP